MKKNKISSLPNSFGNKGNSSRTEEIHGQPYFVQNLKKPRDFLRCSLQFFFASVKGEGYLLSVISQAIFLFLCLIELSC